VLTHASSAAACPERAAYPAAVMVMTANTDERIERTPALPGRGRDRGQVVAKMLRVR
jgi:hypothetical protein